MNTTDPTAESPHPEPGPETSSHPIAAASPVPRERQRCGYVAIVGAPNAGKSTLMNRVVGSKLSIVSPKAQTTRMRVLGIHLQGDAELIFVDTPGIFAPRRRLDRAMVQAAWSGAEDADIIVLLVDAKRGLDADTGRILDGLQMAKQPVVLALNKIDLVRRDSLLTLAQQLSVRRPFERVFMISGLSGDGVGDLGAFLAGAVPPSPWLYPEDQLSDIPLRLLAAEITREQVFLQLHRELPYATMVETETWEEQRDGSVRISQAIIVERPSQKAIVLGAGGRQIKRLGERARLELIRILERPVHLFLFVKVRENWSEERESYEQIGLDYGR